MAQHQAGREDIKLDACTLRQLFGEMEIMEISYKCTAKKFVMLAIQELKEMDDWDLKYLERNDPDIFEVCTRLG